MWLRGVTGKQCHYSFYYWIPSWEVTMKLKLFTVVNSLNPKNFSMTMKLKLGTVVNSLCRDSNGIGKLPQMQLILPYKIS